MFDVKEESTREVLCECYELARAHYYEVEDKSEVVEFELDLDTLGKLIDMEVLCLVTVRTDGVVVGYMANIVSRDAMTNSLVAKELGIYLDPSVRGSKAFIKMMRTVEAVMIKRGVTSQLLAFKEGHDVGLAERLGYKKTETIYQKILEK
jgi:hypothetical protein